MTINGGLQRCIGKGVSRFEQDKDDFIGNMDDMCIHYDGGQVSANRSLVEAMNEVFHWMSTAASNGKGDKDRNGYHNKHKAKSEIGPPSDTFLEAANQPSEKQRNRK